MTTYENRRWSDYSTGYGYGWRYGYTQKISKWVDFKNEKKWHLIWKWKFKDVVCNSLKLVG